MKNNQAHQAVLIAEVIEYLAPKADQYYLDATFGRGGHSSAIMASGAKVIAFDFDQAAIKQAEENFKKEVASGQLILINENFAKMSAVIDNLKKSLDFALAGILFDFGTSTDQLMSSERGFSFNGETDQILDMRMDERLGVKAGDLLKILDEKQLSQVLFEYGGEKNARQIARSVTQVKRSDPDRLSYTATLLEIIEKVKGQKKSGKKSRLHPATKTFQALRIAVNDELSNIEQVLPQAFDLLQASPVKDKRLVTIAFHEGEDRLVKTFFRNCQKDNLAKILTKKPVMAQETELASNPRSRSAKLRALAI